MKDIKTALKENGITEGEVYDNLVACVRENYRTVAEWTKKVDRIAELEAANADLADKAAKVDGDSQAHEELKRELQAMKDAEEKRKADEAEAANRASFAQRFDEALEGREFANSIVRDAVFEKAYAHCTANAGADAKAAIEDAVKGVDNVWVNPQQDPRKMPNGEDMKTSRKSAEEKNFLNALFG